MHQTRVFVPGEARAQIASRVTSSRMSTGLNPGPYASRVGVAKWIVCQIESGQAHRVHFDTFCKVVDGLGLSDEDSDELKSLHVRMDGRPSRQPRKQHPRRTHHHRRY